MPRAAILAATLALLATPAAALPPCPEISVVWTGCTGGFAFDDGAIYVGEWRDDKLHGRGTMYRPDGSIEQEGVWIDGTFSP